MDFFQNYESLLVKCQDGSLLMVYVLLQTFFLELLSLDTSKALYQKNPKLYQNAVVLNFFNHFVVGVPSYAVGILLTTDIPERDNFFIYSLKLVTQIIGITAIHALCYYQIHKIFHTYPRLYKWHKFHHLFNTHVPPLSANAVSPVEYYLAYICPFLVALILLKPCELALWSSILLIGIFNLTMHTPMLEPYFDKVTPQWMAKTANHLEHHKRLNCHYAAPTFDIDYLVEEFGGLFTIKFVNEMEA